MTDLLITSAANPRLRDLSLLRKRRAREQQGRTLVEGFEELELAVRSGVRPRQVFHTPELMGDRQAGERLLQGLRDDGVPVIELSRQAFEKVAYREGPDGFIAVVDVPALAPWDLDLPVAPLLLLAEGVEKPGNLGAMLRTADAAGVDAVIAIDPVTDWGNPNVVRSSKATVFSVPVATGTREEVLGWLARTGATVFAATPNTDVLHTQVELTGPVAIAVGAEKHGLTDEFMAAATRIRIPMAGAVNSLNVATSAAIVLYEAVRQRG